MVGAAVEAVEEAAVAVAVAVAAAEAEVGPVVVAEALAVRVAERAEPVEPVAVARAAVVQALAELEPVELRVAQARAELELRAAEPEQEQVLEQERDLAAEMPAGAVVMLSTILTPVHTDRLTQTGSAPECFRLEAVIKRGLGPALSSDSTNTRLSWVGMGEVSRRTFAIISGPTSLNR
jgi:hypothetical protein